jgi:hypothetical protein
LQGRDGASAARTGEERGADAARSRGGAGRSCGVLWGRRRSELRRAPRKSPAAAAPCPGSAYCVDGRGREVAVAVARGWRRLEAAVRAGKEGQRRQVGAAAAAPPARVRAWRLEKNERA